MNANTKGSALLTIFSIFFVFLIVFFPVNDVFGLTKEERAAIELANLRNQIAELDHMLDHTKRGSEEQSKLRTRLHIANERRVDLIRNNPGIANSRLVDDIQTNINNYNPVIQKSTNANLQATSTLPLTYQKVNEAARKVVEEGIDLETARTGFSFSEREAVENLVRNRVAAVVAECAVEGYNFRRAITGKVGRCKNLHERLIDNELGGLAIVEAAKVQRKVNKTITIGSTNNPYGEIAKYNFIVLNQPSSAPLGEIATERSNADAINISGLYNLAIYIGSGLAILYIALGGINIAIFGKDSAATKASGKSMIVDAILGLLVLLFAYMILNTINPDIINSNTLFSFLVKYG